MSNQTNVISTPKKRKLVPHPNAMTTKEAAAYLTERGYHITHKTLEVYRCRGNRGPKYKRVGSRRIYYEQAWLDEYMAGVEVKVYDPSDMEG